MKPVLAVPATLALIVFTAARKSLTPLGLLAATTTAAAHAYHPWNLPFVLLAVFFLAGTRVTKIKKDVKAKLTLSASGASEGEGPRTHVQVLANSLFASILSVLHAHQLRRRSSSGPLCYSYGSDVLVIGIIAHYAAVAADTFSSELGILSRQRPRLITSLGLRPVPPGTNGGVTLFGFGAGLFGSLLIVTTAVMLVPWCDGDDNGSSGVPWTVGRRRLLMAFLVLCGFCGTLLDSVLGALLQRSVRDVRSGKIVEGAGGGRAMVSAVTAAATRTDGKPSSASRAVETGLDILDNNDVNFLMAVTISVGAMLVASRHWGIPLQEVMKL